MVLSEDLPGCVGVAGVLKMNAMDFFKIFMERKEARKAIILLFLNWLCFAMVILWLLIQLFNGK